jgi:transcriptional regulator with XRE-family HTH domain
MPEPKPSALSLALTYLRTAAGWTKTRLAKTLGHKDESLLSAYERGSKPLTREMLASLVEPLGVSREAVDVLVLAHELIFPELADPAASPVQLTARERTLIDRAVMAAVSDASRQAAGRHRADLTRSQELRKAERARKKAQDLWARLKMVSPKERRNLVAVFPEFWSWALAEHVSHESERMASHSAEGALELANLGLEIARRIPGDESWRSRVTGYCWAFVANARRVANDLSGADEAFVQTWELWRAGESSETGLLAGWRLFDLEASLRRAERRFPEALALLDQARAGCGNDPLATARILLKKEFVFEQKGEIGNALETLKEATPYVEASGDTRLLFALRFNMADDLFHLERYSEAEALLPAVRHLAIEQTDELNLIRVSWLTARIAAGQGNAAEALAGLETVRGAFAQRRLPYDAALVSLDLAVLWLKIGHSSQVKELTVAMSWIFQEKGIDREALAALKLFTDAVQQETVTIDLTQHVIGEIGRVRRSAPPLPRGRDRG